MDATQAMYKYYVKQKKNQKKKLASKPIIQAPTPKKIIQAPTPVLHITQLEYKWFSRLCPNFNKNEQNNTYNVLIVDK